MKTSEFLRQFRNPQQIGSGGWLVRCPSHEDSKASLKVDEGKDRTLIDCKAGCAPSRVVEALGLTLKDLFHTNGNGANGHHPAERGPLTLDAFAGAKGLPAEFLRENGLTEDQRGLLIGYRLADGSPAPRQRRRTALAAKDGSLWEGAKGTALVAYGLWRLDDAREKGSLLVVEGESDALTAWFHNVPCLGIPGADLTKLLTADALKGIDTVYVVKEPDQGGVTFTAGVRRQLDAIGFTGQALVVSFGAAAKDLNELHCQAGSDFAQQLAAAQAAAVPLAIEPAAESPDAPKLLREGFDLSLVWPNGVRFTLAAVRATREGVRGELTVMHGARRLSWGSFSLAGPRDREGLKKKLEALDRDLPWGEYLEEVAYRLTQAAREGEPIVTLTGRVTSPTRELLPRLLYEGEPTLLYADGDTGKSLVALTLATSVHSGASLPFGLTPARAVPVAYLDWETSRDTMEGRLAMLAAGLGVDVPPIIYKRMARPLVDEAAALAADFTRRGIGFVVIDSMMFAVGSGDGAAFHEPITAFYTALRLFAPAAVLVLNHVTGADARGGGPARPFGGAFAFNGPRLIWEAKRDKDITDATAIGFTCTKANNLPRRPEPFGLRFVPGADGTTITVFPLDLTTASATVTAGASMSYHVRLALARGVEDAETIVKDLAEIGKRAKVETVERLIRLERQKGRER